MITNAYTCPKCRQPEALTTVLDNPSRCGWRCHICGWTGGNVRFHVKHPQPVVDRDVG